MILEPIGHRSVNAGLAAKRLETPPQVASLGRFDLRMLPANFSIYKMEWVAEFLASHPQVRIEFVLSDATVDLIEEGIDVAFLRAEKTTAFVKRYSVHGSRRCSASTFIHNFGRTCSTAFIGGSRRPGEGLIKRGGAGSQTSVPPEDWRWAPAYSTWQRRSPS